MISLSNFVSSSPDVGVTISFWYRSACHGRSGWFVTGCFSLQSITYSATNWGYFAHTSECMSLKVFRHVTPSFTVALKSSRSDRAPFVFCGGTPTSRKSPSFLQYSILCSRFRVTEQCACPIVAITWFSLFLD